MLFPKYTKIVRVVLLTLVVALVACSPSDTGSVDEEGTSFYVNSIEMLIMESFPVQVSARVRGDLANGCVVLDGISAERTDNQFTLTTHTRREGDLCTQALVPFEENVALNVKGLAAGTYQVVLGDVSAEFILEMDNSEIVEPESGETIITLERTACFGTCPIYTVAIYGDGRIVYNGHDFVTATGEQTAQIDPQQVQDLVDFMQSNGFNDLEDAYTERRITDMPSAITSLTYAGEFKQIEHYFGDERAPLVLRVIENQIDKVANSEQWTGQAVDNRVVVFGSISVRGEEEILLPKDVVLTIRVEDVSLADAPSVVIAEKTYTELTQLPTFFDVVLQLDAIDVEAMYAVSAEITDTDGNLLYINDTMHSIAIQGMGNMVDVELISVE